MAIKNISITTDAYERLARLKKERESFSDVIKRITRKAKLDDFFGIWDKKTADEIEENIKEMRETHKISREKRIDRISQEFE